MKTLKYMLTGIMLFMIISICCSQTSEKNEQVITLQSVTKTTSKKLLSESREILLRRLEYLKIRDVEIIQNDAKSMLVVKTKDTIRREFLLDILLIQGHVNFYETMNRQEVLKYFRNQTSGCVRDVFTSLHAMDSLRFGSEPIFGMAAAKDTGSINKCLSSKEVRTLLPDQVQLLWTKYPADNNKYFFYCISTSDKTFNENILSEAHADLTHPNQPELCIAFKEIAWQLWKDLTIRNMDKPVAFVIDGKVYFAPRIRSEIPHGKISLTGGGFSKSEVSKLASIISNGAVPLKFKVVGNN